MGNPAFVSNNPKPIQAKGTPLPTKGPGGSSAALGSRSLKSVPGKPAKPSNSRSGQPPVEAPPGQIPDGKPAAPGAEPKLMPEAEAARKGGIMARVEPAPPGVLAEQPDPRTSYQVKPGTDDSSPLIKIGPASASPKPAASGIDTGSQPKAEPKAIPPTAKPEAKATPAAKPSAPPTKEKM